MKTRKQKRRFPVLQLSFFWLLAITVALTFTIRQFQVLAIKRQLKALQEKIQYYSTANEALEAQIEMLKSDEYIEKTAREKLGLVRPGEVQYLLVKDKGGR